MALAVGVVCERRDDSSRFNRRLVLLLLFDLEEEGAVDVRQHTTEGDGGADQGVKLFIATDSKLQVAGGDALDLEVFCGVLHEKQRLVDARCR